MPPDSPTSTQNIQNLFDRIAPVYDALNDWLSLGQHRIWKRMAVKWSGAAAGNTCLDLCCGSGDLALQLARTVGPEGSVVGLDFSAAQLAIAKAKAETSWHQSALAKPTITWVQGDALSIPYADQTFAAITMGYGLRNVVDIPACLKEIHRVLKPGKKAAILDFNRSELPAVEAFQKFYLKHLVVPLATQVGLREEYAYIFPSLERFPTGTEQLQLALAAGFSQAVHYKIAWETMGVLVLTK